jgi:hypothetical protein
MWLNLLFFARLSDHPVWCMPFKMVWCMPFRMVNGLRVISTLNLFAGKCVVYGAAGAPPSWLLPITVDVGTNNAALLADPLYVGQPQQRLRGQPYQALMLEVVNGLQASYKLQVLTLVLCDLFCVTCPVRLVQHIRDRQACLSLCSSVRKLSEECEQA